MIPTTSGHLRLFFPALFIKCPIQDGHLMCLCGFRFRFCLPSQSRLISRKPLTGTTLNFLWIILRRFIFLKCGLIWPQKKFKFISGNGVKQFVSTTSHRTAWPIFSVFGLNESPWLIGVQCQGHFDLSNLKVKFSCFSFFGLATFFKKSLKLLYLCYYVMLPGCSMSATLFLQWPNFDLDLLKRLKLGHRGQTSNYYNSKTSGSNIF